MFESPKYSKEITVDLRSLNTSQFSGVESYTIHVLEELLLNDHNTIYKLFYNGFKKKEFSYFHFINAKYLQTRIPNRILNLSLKLLGYPKLEKLAGPTDVLFMPNLNMVQVLPTTKVVLTIHDLSPLVLPEFYNLKTKLWHKFINIPKLVKRADKLIAVSNFTKTTLVEKLNVPANKIIVASLGVDKNIFKPNLSIEKLRDARNKYSLPGDYILFLGTVEPRKNISRLIEAYEQIKEPLSLVIAGKLGWKYNGILKQINASPKRRNIHLIGYVKEEDKPYIMKLARVFAWPSLYEGFGLPILEAMAVGTPVVTSNVSSMPEVANDAALLVNPYNTNDIAEAVSKLHIDNNLREQYISRGLERVQLFTWKKCADIIKEVIH